jgi:hypothetical protein
MYEVTAFILYYLPLREIDGLSEKSLDRCSALLTTASSPRDEHTDNKEAPRSTNLRIDSTSVSSSCQSSYNFASGEHKISINSKDLINKFHKSVQRNFYAGLATITLALLQVAIGVLLDGTKSLEEIGLSTRTRTWYWYSGLGQVVDKGSSVALYLIMMLSESHWRRAVVPCFLWKEESWDF